ncbi:MAG TPA: cation:proton antiporter, partial [Candidatus Bathyarchaeia archaeon]|nr:cation:proton antiporter [Candidatus Bathyarchaeia archaeon]
MEITNPVLMFSFIMFVILFAPILFERIRLPGIVGLIVSGMMIGPHALGILNPEGSIQLFSSVGLIYIMFLAGLEINLHEFNRQKKYSIVFGLTTFMIPMAIGTFGSKLLFSFSWPCAILLASMFASHTLIPFPIVSRLGINRERSVVTAVGGTIITDTAALLVLAIIAEWTTTDLTAVFWVKQLFFLLALVWFALWVLPRVAYFFFKVLPPDGSVEFLFVLALVFLTGYLASLAGVEPIIGAFFAGLALGGIISEQSPLMNRLEFVGNTLFIPFFLLSVGMLVNLRALAGGWDDGAIALFMVAAVIISKYFASAVFAWIMKFRRDEQNLIFGLSVNQAAATLAAVIVGLRLGIFNDEILNGTILMILVTCFIGPWFTEKYGQRIARLRQRVPESIHPVDERIMVAVSSNKTAEFLMDLALSLRSKNSREPIFPLYVIQDGMEVDRRIAVGEKVLSSVVARVVAANVPVSPLSRIDVTIAGGILHAVKEWHANILIMGSLLSHDSHLKALFFGIYDKVCDESQQLLFLCRMAHPINTDKSIFILIP